MGSFLIPFLHITQNKCCHPAHGRTSPSAELHSQLGTDRLVPHPKRLAQIQSFPDAGHGDAFPNIFTPAPGFLAPSCGRKFGIFQGADPIQVTLRFTPFRARWIREQLWHPAQKITDLADGSLDLSFPVSDFREVKMKILQFGADVKVIQPAALREEIRDEIHKMTALYEI